MGTMPPNPFFIPSYLRHSRYMAKLEAAHKAKLKREREHPSASSVLNTSPGTTRLAPSHRGMTYDIIESNPPREEEVAPPLPSRWSEQDKYPGLDIMSDGQDLRYSGSSSKAEIEAASVRTDHAMPLGCGIYYFEVEIKQKSKDTAIAVGFSTSEASLERLPGWETHSWGYHGDDGKMFFGEHSGRSYGPTFGAGDVIGCGVNFNTCQAFFTKNGLDLGVCFRELKKDLKLYPTIGMKKHTGALVTGNFGQRPFVYDIDDKVLSEKANVSRDISKAKVTSVGLPRDENSLIQDLVAHFLAHDGYVETAKAFAEEMRREKQSLNNALPGNTPTPTERGDTEAVHRQSKFPVQSLSEILC
jgi:Ran-binding protein 9/10